MTPPDVTLRDWFAGQALVGLAGSSTQHVEHAAWDLADAMLAERERRAQVEAKDAEQEAREWVAYACLTVAPNAWGGVCVMDGERVLGTGKDLVAAVADAKATLAAKPTPLAPEPYPAPSTPTREDDEASALDADVTVYRAHPSSGWRAYTKRGAFAITDAEPTIARALRALRALRAKVEGGAR